MPEHAWPSKGLRLDIQHVHTIAMGWNRGTFAVTRPVKSACVVPAGLPKATTRTLRELVLACPRSNGAVRASKRFPALCRPQMGGPPCGWDLVDRGSLLGRGGGHAFGAFGFAVVI